MKNFDLTKMYDAHTHFNDAIYQEENYPVEAIVEEAQQAGVGYFNNVGFSLKSSIKAIEQAKRVDNVYAVVGIHPNEVSKHDEKDFEALEVLMDDEHIVGIGEVGLDYYYTVEDMEIQKEWFIKQINLAIKYNLPLMLHIRDLKNTYKAYDDVLEILKPYQYQLSNIVVHCFSANVEYAEKFLEIGAYIEIGGAVTFKNAAELHEVAKFVPLNKMLIETDAPYLTPHPYRGQINYSKYLGLTANKIAELKNVDVEQIIKQTTQNAINIFIKDKIN